MKRKMLAAITLLTLLAALLPAAAPAETRQGVIFLEGEEQPIEEALFESPAGFSFWYADESFTAYAGSAEGSAVVAALYSDDRMTLSLISEKEAEAYIRDIAVRAGEERVQTQAYSREEGGWIRFGTLIAENGRYLMAEGRYSREAAEGNAKYFDRVLDSVTLMNEYDLQFLKELPGEWTFTAYLEEEGAGEEAPEADLAFLTVEENGKISLLCYDMEGRYAFTCEGAWSYEPVPNYGGHLTLLFTSTDDPAQEGKEYRLECVYEAYTESWVENDTLVTYLILDPQISCSGVSPFEALYGETNAALHREKGPNMHVVRCREFVFLRETPSTSAKRLARVPLGASVLAFPEEGETNGFIRCVYQNEDGYILAEYLQINE